MVDVRTEGREDQAVDDQRVRAVVTRLAAEFGRNADDLEGPVRTEFSRWSEARVTQFVPVLVERRLRDELRGR